MNNAQKAVRVLLGDDHALMLNGIRGLLSGHYEVIGTAQNGQALVDAALQFRPEIVVLDISMPVLNGIEAARHIKKELPSTSLVFLSMHGHSLYLRRALDAGASAYVLKSSAPEELLTALNAVGNGETYISPELGRPPMENAARPVSEPQPQSVKLTDRQRQILQMVAGEWQNKEMAVLLGVSAKTLEVHRGRLMTKLGARNAAELVRWAIQEGLVDPALK